MIYIHADDTHFASHLANIIPNSYLFDADITQISAAIQQHDAVHALVIPQFAQTQPLTLAHTLNWTPLTYVTEILSVQHDYIRVKRWGRGGLQTVSANYPVVISVLPEIITEPLPLNLDTSQVAYTAPLQNKLACTLLRGASPQVIAAQLVDILRHSGIFDNPAGIKIEAIEPASPPLTSAPILVAAGKGIAYHPVPAPPDTHNPFAWKIQYAVENMLQPLAHALGGRLAATRAVIDSGGIGSAYQVGQSGKRVTPDLYFAAGISGSVQHLQGMQSSRLIVAINTDPDAPIFEAAHYGVVGDVAQIVPALTAEIQKRGLAASS